MEGRTRGRGLRWARAVCSGNQQEARIPQQHGQGAKGQGEAGEVCKDQTVHSPGVLQSGLYSEPRKAVRGLESRGDV